MFLSDTFGLFLQMTIVALCSMVLVCFVAILKPQTQRASRNDGDTQLVGR